MILPDLFLRIYFQRFIRCPHDERNLDLFLRRDKYGHAVHIQIPLAEGLSVVGYEDHATAPLGNPAKNFYYGMNEIIRVDDGVVFGSALDISTVVHTGLNTSNSGGYFL